MRRRWTAVIRGQFKNLTWRTVQSAAAAVVASFPVCPARPVVSFRPAIRSAVLEVLRVLLDGRHALARVSHGPFDTVLNAGLLFHALHLAKDGVAVRGEVLLCDGNKADGPSFWRDTEDVGHERLYEGSIAPVHGRAHMRGKSAKGEDVARVECSAESQARTVVDVDHDCRVRLGIAGRQVVGEIGNKGIFVFDLGASRSVGSKGGTRRMRTMTLVRSSAMTGDSRWTRSRAED